MVCTDSHVIKDISGKIMQKGQCLVTRINNYNLVTSYGTNSLHSDT
jgi:hypothetical protein